jgi:hypothetical protein
LFFYCFRGNIKLNYYLEQIIKEKLMNEHHNKKLTKQSSRNIDKQQRKLKRAKSMMNIKKDNKRKLSHKIKSKSQKKIGIFSDINENANKKHIYKNDERNKNEEEGHINIYNRGSKKNIKSKERKKDKLFPPKKKLSRNIKFKNSLEHSEKNWFL